jgi:hypothetical protein
MKSSSLRAGHSNLGRQPEETQWVCRAVKSMSLGWSYDDRLSLKPRGPFPGAMRLAESDAIRYGRREAL